MKSRFGVFYKFAALVICAVISFGALAGCSEVKNMVSGAVAAGEFPVEIGDVTVSARPQKAVVLSPSLADVVLAMGYETQLAGSSDDCDQATLNELQKVSATDSQAVIELSPDLVLADSFSDEMASALSGANITMLAVAPATDREDFERLYSQVSAAFAGGGAGYDAGVKAAQDIFLTLDTINRIVPKDKVTTACYLYDLDGKAVTGDMFGSTVMSYAGVTNVFKSITGGTYEFESLKISNPNVIFCAPGLSGQLKADSRFKNFQAVKNNKVVELEPGLMERQGRTVIETAYQISAAAFPELLEENSMVVTDPTKGIESAVSSALASSAAESDTTKYTALQQGDEGDEVLAMQKRLDELGYLDTDYDGHYGEFTAACVKDFQKANGLEETGAADEKTQKALFAKAAKAKGAADTSSTSSESSAS